MSPASAASALPLLIVVTSHGDIAGRPTTGLWFTEFSEPFAFFTAAGLALTIVSPRGGPAPVDPRGYPAKAVIAEARDALATLNATLPLASVRPEDFSGVFFPGGHGPMFDLATDPATKTLIAAFWRAGKPVGAVCHGPAALLDVKLDDGATLLAGRRVTGFSKAEDAKDSLFAHMPFSLEARMSAEGARFVAGPAHQPHAETDGRLVTGQNPASALVTAEAFLRVLRPSAEA